MYLKGPDVEQVSGEGEGVVGGGASGEHVQCVAGVHEEVGDERDSGGERTDE